ncbi:MAG: hypothetical protein Ta2D_03730 [Rickettsiales bacterium]|nr:MAG: hypothetical protein Ta2D_03730 [Rickettsiales bacterium]
MVDIPKRLRELEEFYNYLNLSFPAYYSRENLAESARSRAIETYKTECEIYTSAFEEEKSKLMRESPNLSSDVFNKEVRARTNMRIKNEYIDKNREHDYVRLFQPIKRQENQFQPQAKPQQPQVARPQQSQLPPLQPQAKPSQPQKNDDFCLPNDNRKQELEKYFFQNLVTSVEPSARMLLAKAHAKTVFDKEKQQYEACRSCAITAVRRKTGYEVPLNDALVNEETIKRLKEKNFKDMYGIKLFRKVPQQQRSQGVSLSPLK